MFEESVANALQLVSLPFEVLGFLLALIEIRYTKVAEYFRRNIVAAIVVSEEPFWVSQRRMWRDKKFQIGWPAFLMLVFAILIFIGDPVGFAILAILFLQVMQLLVGVGFRRVAKGMFRFVQYFSEGREIGTLGLMLASVGVMAEVYQFGASIGSDIVTRPNTVPGFLLLVGWTVLAFGYFLLALGIVGFYKNASERT